MFYLIGKINNVRDLIERKHDIVKCKQIKTKIYLKIIVTWKTILCKIVALLFILLNEAKIKY